jgi:hypothetical protein
MINIIDSLSYNFFNLNIYIADYEFNIYILWKIQTCKPLNEIYEKIREK